MILNSYKTTKLGTEIMSLVLNFIENGIQETTGNNVNRHSNLYNPVGFFFFLSYNLGSFTLNICTLGC